MTDLLPVLGVIALLVAAGGGVGALLTVAYYKRYPDVASLQMEMAAPIVSAPGPDRLNTRTQAISIAASMVEGGDFEEAAEIAEKITRYIDGASLSQITADED